MNRPFFSTINYTNFFLFDKKLVLDKIWCALPLSSKKVYPAIACHANAAGVAFPSEITLAALTGQSCKTVRAGIAGLESMPGFTATHFVNSHGKWAKKYHIVFPPKEKGRAYPFYRHIIDGGNWRQSSLAACSLYAVMRCFGFYEEEEDPIASGLLFDEAFKGRKFDYCEADMSILQVYSGLSRQAVYSGLQALVDAELIERDGGQRWKVFLHPEKYFKREYLNAAVQKSLQSELRSV